MRKLYADRLCHVIKDFSEQPEGKFCVFVQDLFGDKVVITCDKVEISPVAIVLKQDSTKISEPGGVMVGMVPAESVWGIIANDRVINMTGRQWEQHKIDDAKNQLDLFTEQYGTDKLVSVALLPDGRQLRLPVEDEAKETIKKAATKEPEGQPTLPTGAYR